MHPSFAILFIGLLYILGFGALSFMRRQGLSTRFAGEGIIVTAIGVGLSFVVPVQPVVFLVAIYLVTLRVRLMVDLGNWLCSREQYEQALNLSRFAIRLGPDQVTSQIVLINRGVIQLRMQKPEDAYLTLKAALVDERIRAGAKYLAAGYYNLGLACRRTGREPEAIRHFNGAIDTLPTSLYAHGARQALKEGKTPKKTQRRTEEIEHEADILRREIFSILTTGAIDPNAREDLMHIVKRMDDVAHNANASVRRMSLLNVGEFPDELKDLILQMMSHSLECSDMLKECIEKLGIDATEILRLTDRIGEIEHKVDLLNSKVKSFLIQSQLTQNPFEAIVVLEFIERIENVADACEDTADIVKLMALRDEVRY